MLRLLPVFLIASTVRLRADDWPQWMGPQRDGVWRETGIVEALPEGGPKVLWRVPVKAGYVGPAVAAGRVYLLDREADKPAERKPGERPTMPGNERLLCLDAASGKTVWERTYDCPYAIAYPSGPRATPLVNGGKVFTLGAMGDLRCSKTEDGALVWSHRLPEEFHTAPPVWGYASHPLLDENRLICLVGGTNSAVVAFDKDSGKEIWRALTAKEIGYAPPVIHTVDGTRQLIVWHPDAVSGLDPVTGMLLWSHPYPVDGRPQRPEVTIAMPRVQDDLLFLTSFYHGSLLLRIPPPSQEATVVWNRHSRKQSVMDDGLHSLMSTPLVLDGNIYGICAAGELRCLDLKTGDRRWESLDIFGGEAGFFANAFLVRQGDRCFFWNDHGELGIGKLSPDGFKPVGRAKLLEPQENTRGRDVLWCHPAFADRSAIMHNGRELIRVSLAKDDV